MKEQGLLKALILLRAKELETEIPYFYDDDLLARYELRLTHDLVEAGLDVTIAKKLALALAYELTAPRISKTYGAIVYELEAGDRAVSRVSS